MAVLALELPFGQCILAVPLMIDDLDGTGTVINIVINGQAGGTVIGKLKTSRGTGAYGIIEYFGTGTAVFQTNGPPTFPRPKIKAVVKNIKIGTSPLGALIVIPGGNSTGIIVVKHIVPQGTISGGSKIYSSAAADSVFEYKIVFDQAIG